MSSAIMETSGQSAGTGGGVSSLGSVATQALAASVGGLHASPLRPVVAPWTGIHATQTMAVSVDSRTNPRVASANRNTSRMLAGFANFGYYNGILTNRRRGIRS